MEPVPFSFWLASRPNHALSWGQAGGSLRAESAGSWWAAIAHPECHPAFLANRATILARWDERFQDRLNELVFIGQDLDEPRIRLCRQVLAGSPWRSPHPLAPSPVERGN